MITGPSDSNIVEDIESLLRHDAIVQVPDYPQLQQQLRRLLHDPGERAGLEARARMATQARADVLATYLQVINPYLR